MQNDIRANYLHFPSRPSPILLFSGETITQNSLPSCFQLSLATLTSSRKIKLKREVCAFILLTASLGLGMSFNQR